MKLHFIQNNLDFQQHTKNAHNIQEYNRNKTILYCILENASIHRLNSIRQDPSVTCRRMFSHAYIRGQLLTKTMNARTRINNLLKYN